MSLLRLARGAWAAEVSTTGAELQRLQWRGRDLLWNGDPAWWGRRAPLLFPVVGAVRDGLIRVAGRVYPMPKHGFARDLTWEVVDEGESEITLRLLSSEATRGAYPFGFDLRLTYTLHEEGLSMTARLRNPGAVELPAAFGFHPAFRWPLDPTFTRDAHELRFEYPEPGPLRRLRGDLLDQEAHLSPVDGNRLLLRDGLFDDDALIFENLKSRSLRFGPPDGFGLRLRWDLPHFGIWTKPGAPFLCLEPWQGFADPVGFEGEFQHKPGNVLLAPGTERVWTYLISGVEPSE